MIDRILSFFFPKPKPKNVKQCEGCNKAIPAGPDFCCIDCWKLSFDKSVALYERLVEDERRFNRSQEAVI